MSENFMQAIRFIFAICVLFGFQHCALVGMQARQLKEDAGTLVMSSWLRSGFQRPVNVRGVKRGRGGEELLNSCLKRQNVGEAIEPKRLIRFAKKPTMLLFESDPIDLLVRRVHWGYINSLVGESQCARIKERAREQAAKKH